MKTGLWEAVVCVCVAAGLALTAAAKPFENEFTLAKVSGDCKVKPAGSLTYVAAQEGKAYAYGTVIRTERGASAAVKFSEGNECRISANTRVAITQDRAKTSDKALRLDTGAVEVELESGFDKNNSLKVETPTAVCAALGTFFTVEAGSVADLATTKVEVKKGKVLLEHKCFLMPLLETGDAALLSTSLDGKFGRLKVVNGEYELDLRDAKGLSKALTLKTDTVVECQCSESVDGTKLIIIIQIMRPGETQPEIIRIERVIGPTEPRFLEPEPKSPTTTIPVVTPVGKT